MSQSMGNILNRPIPAVPVRLAAVAAFAVTLTDRRKGSPARADPYPAGVKILQLAILGCAHGVVCFGIFHAKRYSISGGVSLLTRIKDVRYSSTTTTSTGSIQTYMY